MPGPVARPGDTAEIKRNRSILTELSGSVHRQLVSLLEEYCPVLSPHRTAQCGILEKGQVTMTGVLIGGEDNPGDTVGRLERKLNSATYKPTAARGYQVRQR